MRAENFYHKHQVLRKCNEDFAELLQNLLHQEMVIFKDKYNFKPPSGEGYFCHYDGIYKFKCNGIEYDGWYKYAPDFWNISLALDNCTKENGALQVSNIHNLSFNQLYENTVKNGTPKIRKEIVENLDFNLININKGDLFIFNNKCPHKSDINNSNTNRNMLYYTYNSKEFGDNYNKYFSDKKKTDITVIKSLSEK